MIDVETCTTQEAYQHARDVIKGRWILAEHIILRDPDWTHAYAEDVVKGRWFEAEHLILADPHYACVYASGVLKGRWPIAEKEILVDPQDVVWYAIHSVTHRWVEGEGVIFQYHDNTVEYADMVGSRWIEAENVILQDHGSSFEYALCNIQSRWPMIETKVPTDPCDLGYTYDQYTKGLGFEWVEGDLLLSQIPSPPTDWGT